MSYQEVNHRYHRLIRMLTVHTDGTATVSLKSGGGFIAESPEEIEKEMKRLAGKENNDE